MTVAWSLLDKKIRGVDLHPPSELDMRIMVCFYYYAQGAHVNPPPPLGCIFNVCDPARIKVDSLSKALGFWNGKLFFFFFPLWLLSMQTSPPCYD